MASYLTANPDEAECIAYHRLLGQFVPIARNGSLLALVNHQYIDAEPIASPLPVADYVVGLEMLGFSFLLWEPQEGVQKAFRVEPANPLPPAWERQEMRIMAAFGPRRGCEVAAFLRAREEGQ